MHEAAVPLPDFLMLALNLKAFISQEFVISGKGVLHFNQPFPEADRS